MLNPDARIAIFMEDAIEGPSGKMGFGVLRYSPNPIVSIIDSTMAGRDIVALTGIPRPCPIVASINEAVALGAEVIVLGIAPPGGLIPAPWWPMIEATVKGHGLSLVNGLHDLIGPRFPGLATEPTQDGTQFIWDIRIEPKDISTGSGLAAKLDCMRLLLIGTDMAVGKMTAALEIARAAREAGTRTGFVATGQIGITITGSGIPLDAIRVDFASGAVEREVLRHSNAGAELIVVEGQGSLIHPSSTANLPLIRGSCPTHYILCHRAGQNHLRSFPDFEIPPLENLIALYETVGSACDTFDRPRTAAVALNTLGLSDAAAKEACEEIEADLRIPCVDPIRHGPERLLASLYNHP